MDENEKHKGYFSVFHEREGMIREFLRRSLLAWEGILEELTDKTGILFRRSFEAFQRGGKVDVNDHTLRGDEEEIGKGYSSLFIYHHVLSNSIIPLITSLLIPNGLDKDLQSPLAHS